MNNLSANQLSVAFARRLQNDARFMAYVLAAYRRQEGLSEEELASELGIWPEMLTRLALCQRPHSDATQFAEQVRRIADYTLIDEAQLAGMLRQVESLERLAQRPLTAPAMTEQSLPVWGVLAAARDCEDEEANDDVVPSLAKDE
ncbi:MAG: hypothetical protein JNM09_23905 [Blastocatellia bacterium]|nr:hypothetical protein [Blastocatellia bacterium]